MIALIAIAQIWDALILVLVMNLVAGVNVLKDLQGRIVRNLNVVAPYMEVGGLPGQRILHVIAMMGGVGLTATFVRLITHVLALCHRVSPRALCVIKGEALYNPMHICVT